ncbi:hypothetical protein MTAT_04580 [Moorella thermoacetica]|uniref:Uncharacterized protein n=1 Tax=Neomoorella thermoacetica TaxID=1525 RepID=A0AAC9HIX4_NEOTH|nr:hypothetical protein [Moorella thermoacetica]AOQ24743.1 hypothetical protein Maut_02315 [Moorella thermoacetica]TYL15719.1 hypothetical protein MTAT_04580 [Moorella thermoacetica]
MLRSYRYLWERVSTFLIWARESQKNLKLAEQSRLDMTFLAQVRNFFSRLGRPALILRPAMSHRPPLSADYNDMLKEIHSDIAQLLTAGDNLVRQLQDDFDFHSQAYRQLADRVNVLGQDLENLVLKAKSHSSLNAIQENFRNPGSFSSSSVTRAYVDGQVTLAQETLDNVSPISSVRINVGDILPDTYILGRASNGFPGNTHEMAGNTLVGYHNAHIDYTAVNDGNPDTWFEYELVNVEMQYKSQYGFSYVVEGDKKIRWDRDPEDGVLKLCLEFRLPEVRPINQITVLSYIPPKGRPPQLISVKISADGVEAPVTVPARFQCEASEKINVIFASRPAKLVQVYFAQPFAYETDVGHIYYEFIGDNNYQLTKENIVGRRVDGPEPSISILGASLDDDIYPFLQQGENKSMSDVLNDLLAKVGDPRIEQGVERLPGRRYCIGLRDISLYSIRYAQTSEIISPPYHFDSPIGRLMLDAEEFIPSEFGDGQWLTYYFNVGGGEWFPISPLNRNGDIWHFSVDPFQAQDIMVKDRMVVTKRPVDSLRIKIGLKRPAEHPYLTPIVYNYRVLTLPEGVAFHGA